MLINDFQEGKYIGTFKRANFGTAKVEIVFIDNSWYGSSSKIKYPALCRGSYTISDDVISFSDSCFWTAEFDPSLILHGNYRMKIRNDGIEIYRLLPHFDIYILKKE